MVYEIKEQYCSSFLCIGLSRINLCIGLSRTTPVFATFTQPFWHNGGPLSHTHCVSRDLIRFSVDQLVYEEMHILWQEAIGPTRKLALQKHWRLPWTNLSQTQSDWNLEAAANHNKYENGGLTVPAYKLITAVARAVYHSFEQRRTQTWQRLPTFLQETALNARHHLLFVT